MYAIRSYYAPLANRGVESTRQEVLNIDNIVLYDWFTMTSKIDSADSIIRLLGLNKDGISFQHLNGRYGYKDRLFFNEINIYYNGRDDMGICLEMSGQGCRAFEEYGTSEWSVLFRNNFV